MRLLAVDTATEVCGVALWEDDRILAEMSSDTGTTHARVLMAAIRAVLDKNGLQPAALDALVVTRGPGSFTGLRIGISTVKGLAAAAGKPLVGVSTLEVLARQAPADAGQVCPMIDARRREVYWSVYRRGAAGLVQTGPEKAGPAIDVQFGGDEECLFIGNGAQLYAQALKDRFPGTFRMVDPDRHALRPSVVAHLGALRFRQGFTDDPHGFSPIYLRKSDAELAR